MSSNIVSIVVPPSFDCALTAAQALVPGAAPAFVAAYDDWIARTVAALCRHHGVLPQEHADVKQETYRRLLDPDHGRFAPARGGGRSYVRGVILNAINVAGRRRLRTRVSTSLDVDAEGGVEVDLEWRKPFNGVDAQHDLPRLLRHGDAIVRRAVSLICGGRTQREAATEIGVSEFKLCRALAKFSAEARSAG